MAKVVFCCLFLAGCGTFQLAQSVTAPSGKSRADMRVDLLDCKDRARTYAGTGDKQARAFMLGLTVVGTPLAYAADRSDQREEFRVCMESAGYVVKEVR